MAKRTQPVRHKPGAGSGLTALGRRVTKFERLETFAAPEGSTRVTLVSDEVTAMCPVTGQPDYYTVTIEYEPKKFCVESKTVKLYLHQFRNKGIFCEALADKIAKDFASALKCWVKCIVEQKPRGGVGIKAEAAYSV